MRVAVLLFAVLLVAGCDSPTDSVATDEIVVLSRNIYLGGDVAPVLASPPQEIPGAVAALWAQVAQTDFAARADALADEIAAAKPHLIGLQEVSLWRVQSPGDFISGNAELATNVRADFLAVLLAELEERGLDYSAVAVSQSVDVELPMFREMTEAGPAFDDLRYTDRDVILARGDVVTADAQNGLFEARLAVPPLVVTRGWASVQAKINGNTFRFVNAHLETSDLAPIQIAQGNELLSIVANDPLPVILVGDLNSSADGGTTPTYANVLAAGFSDAWREANGSTPGLTCCQTASLTDEASALDQRIDFVFLSEGLQALSPVVSASLSADVIGADQNDRTASGLWPSDHAGVLVRFEIPRS